MVPIRNPLDLYALLPQTNCGECPARTCLAFASALVRGGAKTADCPQLAADGAIAIAAHLDGRKPAYHEQEAELLRLRAGVAALDFASSAERLGARVVAGNLAVKSLGKDFTIDAAGRISSDCHTHPGLAIPLLRYVLFSRGGRPCGSWLPFRELSGAGGRSLHFEQMCEKPLKRLVDTHTELLKDLIDLFSGELGESLRVGPVARALPAPPDSRPDLLLGAGGWHGIVAARLFRRHGDGPPERGVDPQPLRRARRHVREDCAQARVSGA